MSLKQRITFLLINAIVWAALGFYSMTKVSANPELKFGVALFSLIAAAIVYVRSPK